MNTTTKRWNNDDGSIPALPDLVLGQQGVTDLGGETRKPRLWFVWEVYHAGIWTYEAGSNFLSYQGEKPVATVSIVLPLVMVGSEQEIHDDMRSAAIRHATKHIPSLT